MKFEFLKNVILYLHSTNKAIKTGGLALTDVKQGHLFFVRQNLTRNDFFHYKQDAAGYFEHYNSHIISLDGYVKYKVSVKAGRT